MWSGTRRDFLKAGAVAAVGLGSAAHLLGQIPGERPGKSDGVSVLNPQTRVPLSMIIDDSTCLVNLAHFGMPQFAAAWPERESYKKPWRDTPREIPDAFVRKFGQWCREHGVKGKYSVVPYPACVGWVDRIMPGWSRRELLDSLKLVRTLMTPDWDIHPEMVSHTRVIDTSTGRPYPECTPEFMENWRWTDGKSVDQLADYMSYALRILKNVDLPCEGITTPGGFGNRVLPELAQATLESCRDVFAAEIPHYFRHLYTDDQSVAPRVEYASGLAGPDPRCVVSIIGCTGDWFGGWDGMTPGSVDRFITEDLGRGRMVDVIARGEPAIMVCHWPGIYFNGEELGFNIFKEVVKRLEAKYDHLIWMKLSEIARYWAARELTRIERNGGVIDLDAPFSTERFTLSVAAEEDAVPKLSLGGKPRPLREVSGPLNLLAETWTRGEDGLTVCFDLSKGKSRLEV
ncbi:MAG: twin-arginine translocation signal domain-containing protein [Planctomycetes bacterium]|nr:twin-arginine translocation signal domain-containing protein [Planctomycetota bacterium]